MTTQPSKHSIPSAKLDQKSSDSPYGKAQELILQQNFADALPYLIEAGEADNPFAYIWLSIIYARGHEGVPSSFEETQRWQQKIIESKAWYEAEAKKPQAWEARFAQAYIHLHGLGVEANPRLALEYAESANKIKPFYYPIINLCGSALFKLGRFVEATEYYKESLKYEPKSVIALNGVANALCLLRRFNEALAILNKALAIHPDDMYLLNGRAVVLDNKKQYADALRDYEKALEKNPGCDDICLKKAKLLIRSGEKPAALLELISILDRNAKNVEAQDEYKKLTGKNYADYREKLEIVSKMIAHAGVFYRGRSTPSTPKTSHAKDEEETILAGLCSEYSAEQHLKAENETNSSCIIS